eukprot:53104_1
MKYKRMNRMMDIVALNVSGLKHSQQSLSSVMSSCDGSSEISSSMTCAFGICGGSWTSGCWIDFALVVVNSMSGNGLPLRTRSVAVLFVFVSSFMFVFELFL